MSAHEALRPMTGRERYVVLAEGAFDAEWAKTAASLIRYRPERVVAVLDSTRAGYPVSEILGFGGAIPILANLDEALALEPTPTALLIGIAPQGGGLPEAWRPVLRMAIEAGLACGADFTLSWETIPSSPASPRSAVPSSTTSGSRRKGCLWARDWHARPGDCASSPWGPTATSGN